MNKRIRFCLLALLLPLCAFAQSDQHYTMFMYNKLLYNPAYTGSRDVTSINAQYRSQWSGIPGAPKTLNFTMDGPVGSYMRPFRPVAVGGSITNEKIGVENNTHIRAYYAYRLRLSKSTLSFGLSGGGTMYSANYNNLSPQQLNDPNLATNVNNAFLPNFGAGAYWTFENLYVGVSVPNLLENHYDKNGTRTARQVRGYYISAGYVYTVNDVFKLKPQVLARYAGNGDYKLPFSCDMNLSAIAYDRLMVGITYRTDKSLAATLHMQVTTRINLGYSYDYLMSDIAPYARGAHEIAVGFDIVRESSKFLTPRFIKKF